MPVALVRSHNTGASVTAATTIAATVATADVPVDRLLVVWAGSRNAAAVTSLTKPGGETAAWTKVASFTHGSGSISGELWILKTTVVWPVGTTVTATFASSQQRRAIGLVEYSGVDTVLRGAAGTGTGANGQASASITTGLLAGDLVLAGASLAAGDFFDDIALDTDTTNGSWAEVSDSGSRTGFGDTTALNLSLQHKILTGSGTQTFNAIATNDHAGSPAPTYQSVGVAVVALRASNVAPNAPTLTSMVGGVTINRANTNRATWVFSDPNAGDSQSAYDLRYRLVGAGSWTNVHGAVPNQFYDFTAGALAAGDYEWQVSTTDSLGVQGPYSPSEFFTAGDAPAGPTITSPTNGSTVDASDGVTWSTANQDVYQVRRVADVAGAPDTGTIYYDSGEVTSTEARSAGLSFPVNGRAEHVQVRVKYAGLWSPWSTVAVDVSYTPPPVPLVVISSDPSTASLLFTITNPAPAGGDPAAAYNDIYVDDGTGEERKATLQPTNTPWRYWTPVSGRDYANSVRVIAVAANGTTSSSS